MVNETRVLKRRIFTDNHIAILFLDMCSSSFDESGVAPEVGIFWEVLFPAKKYRLGDVIDLPGGVSMELIEKGVPQKIKTSQPLNEEFFSSYGELALPPYIQKARGERHSSEKDHVWYQTDWARVQGSYAAPTASLHFSQSDLDELEKRGVKVLPLVLHVGLGTFLPVRVEDLSQHKMHKEEVWIPEKTLDALNKGSGRVFALGTTVARSLEAWAAGHLAPCEDGVRGHTDLFIRPPYQFSMVDVLMTNFHQPKSTLLALVSAFAGVESTMKGYQYAIEKEFRLFSYGHLSVWIKE